MRAVSRNATSVFINSVIKSPKEVPASLQKKKIGAIAVLEARNISPVHAVVKEVWALEDGTKALLEFHMVLTENGEKRYVVLRYPVRIRVPLVGVRQFNRTVGSELRSFF